MTDINITQDANLTTNTSPALADRLLLVRNSDSVLTDITPDQLMKILNLLTADSSPADDDKLLSYDTSTSAVKSVLLSVMAARTETLTNKRVTPRVTSETSSATPTINTDNSDCHSITALATAITSMTTNLSGTPTNFQKLMIRIKDNGTARAITWGASFESKGVTLPTTTVLSKVLTVGLLYDTVSAKWGCVAVANEA